MECLTSYKLNMYAKSEWLTQVLQKFVDDYERQDPQPNHPLKSEKKRNVIFPYSSSLEGWTERLYTVSKKSLGSFICML